MTGQQHMLCMHWTHKSNSHSVHCHYKIAQGIQSTKCAATRTGHLCISDTGNSNNKPMHAARLIILPVSVFGICRQLTSSALLPGCPGSLGA